jgi:hypothetical protein
MALIHVNRCAQQTTGTGVGDVLLSSPLPAHQRIYDAIDSLGVDPELSQFVYWLADGDGLAWELGYGSLSVSDPFDPDTTTSLVRNATESSNAGAEISLSTGTHTVRVVPVGIQLPSIQPDSGAGELGAQSEGIGSIAIGGNSEALVEFSIALGAGAKARNAGSVCIGHGSQSLSDHAMAIGKNAVAQISGALTLGSGDSTSQYGDAFLWAGKGTSTGTSVSPILHTTSAGDSPIEIAEGMVVIIEALVVGQRTAPSAARAGFKLTAVVYRASGVDVILGSVTKTTIAVTGGATPDVNITISGGTIRIGAQGGASGETWNWSASVRGALQVGA